MPGIRFGGSSGGSSSLAYKQSFITADVTLNNSTPTEVTSLDLTAGTWLIIATLMNSSEAIGCDIDFWLDSVSGAISASPYGGSGITQNVTGTTSYYPETTGSVVAIIALTSAQTVYLNAEAIGQNGVATAANAGGVGGSTGIVAVQIG